MKIAEQVLSRIIKDQLLEEILGDLQEYWYDLRNLPSWKRSLFFWFQLIHFIRPFALKIMKNKASNQLYLYRNYYKTSLRSMARNPLSSFINVFGLSLALGVAIWVYSFVQHDLRLDSHHVNDHKIYFSTAYLDREGEMRQYGMSPVPLVEALSADFSSVDSYCRVQDLSVILKHEDRVFHESVRFTDPSFLEMLTFPMQQGIGKSLNDPNNIILSYDMGIKYFGDENPIGKQMLMKFDGGHHKLFTVSGVADEFPVSHQIHFDFLVSFENMDVARPDFSENDWSEFLTASMIIVDNPDEVSAIEEHANQYVTIQNEVQKDWAIDHFVFEQLEGFHLRSRGIKRSIVYDRYYEGRVTLPVIAVMILILACLNYVNIAIVSASRRLKEIGIRKVIGANRVKIVSQFLAENILVTFFALIVGVIIAVFLLLPWFRGMTGILLYLEFSDIQLWFYMIGIMLLTGIISGLYPAFYIGRFDIIRIFRGHSRFGKKNTLTKIFLGLQLVFACLGVTAAVMFANNSDYQRNRDWGYAEEGVIYTSVPDRSAFDRLAALTEQEAGVRQVVGSKHHLGESSVRTVMHLPDKEYEVQLLEVGDGYLETMGLELDKGRWFRSNHESDKKTIVINEHLAQNLQWNDPLGQVVRIDSVQYQVVGVLKNFHFNNFYYEMDAFIFTLAEDEDYRFLSMRVEPGKELDSYTQLRENWLELFPEEPFLAGHQSDIWVNFYEDLKVMNEFQLVMALIAMFLASLGLYGLISLNVAGRGKEFSVRKALGAQLSNLISVISYPYMILGGISLIIGAPLSYFLVRAQIDMMFPDPRPMEIRGVFIAVLIIITVLVLVMSTQIFKVSKSNPVDGLRVE